MKLQLRAKHLIDSSDLSGEGICKGGMGEVTCMFTSNLLTSMNISSPEEKREEMVRKIKERQEAGDLQTTGNRTLRAGKTLPFISSILQMRPLRLDQ